MADILTTEELGTPTMGGTGVGAVNAQMANAARRTDYEALFQTKAKDLVKGVGHITNNGVPLSEGANSGEILTKATQAAIDVRTATMQGVRDADSVMDRMSRDFIQNRNFAPMYYQLKNSANVQKSFTATNLGLGGTPYGLVPFDLLAPSRLIYPVYTLFRNKFPRPAGQGASRQVYGLLGVSGSQTGGQGVVDISMPELVSSSVSGSFGGSTGNWPLNIPKTGSQTEYKLNVPYRFFGLTEALSWLAQFEGQGFEDISALANLVLLQEMMLGEEYQMLAGSSQNLAAPAAPTLVARVAGSNETALTGVTTPVAVKVSALNYFGESVGGTASSTVAWVTGWLSTLPSRRLRALSSTTFTPSTTPARITSRRAPRSRPAAPLPRVPRPLTLSAGCGSPCRALLPPRRTLPVLAPIRPTSPR